MFCFMLSILCCDTLSRLLNPKPQMSNNGAAEGSNLPSVSRYISVDVLYICSNSWSIESLSLLLTFDIMEPLLYPERDLSIAKRALSTRLLSESGEIFSLSPEVSRDEYVTVYVPPWAYPENL